MQVVQNQIKRPKLIEPFFDKELTLDNEFVTYIDCTQRSTSNVNDDSNVTPVSHNIKNSLKTKKFGARFELKYNRKRFYMNEAGYINIDMKIFHKSELPAIA